MFNSPMIIIVMQQGIHAWKRQRSVTRYKPRSRNAGRINVATTSARALHPTRFCPPERASNIAIENMLYLSISI